MTNRLLNIFTGGIFRRQFILWLCVMAGVVWLVENAGSKWYADTQLTHDNTNMCRLYQKGSACLGKDNIIHFVWYNDKIKPRFPEIYYLSIKGGAPGPSERLTYDPDKSTEPCIVEDSKGDLHVIWRDDKDGGRILSRSKSGQHWGNIAVVCEKGLRSDNPTMCIDSKDVVHLLYQGETREGKKLFYQTMKNGKWSSETLISNSSLNVSHPYIYADYRDNLHVVFENLERSNREIFYMMHAKGTWSVPERLTNDKEMSMHPVVAADRVGKVNVVWYDRKPGNLEIYFRQKRGSWGPEVRLTQNPRTSINPFISIDSKNLVHIVWADSMDDADMRHPWNFEIYHGIGDGVNWSSGQRLTNHEEISTHPLIVLDKKDNIYLFWEDKRGKTDEIYFKQFVAEPGKEPVLAPYGQPTEPGIQEEPTEKPPSPTPVPAKTEQITAQPRWTTKKIPSPVPTLIPRPTRTPRPRITFRPPVTGLPTITPTFTHTVFPTDTPRPTGTFSPTHTANWVATLKAARIKKKPPTKSSESRSGVPYYYRPEFPPTRTFTQKPAGSHTPTPSLIQETPATPSPTATLEAPETPSPLPAETPAKTSQTTTMTELEMFSTQIKTVPTPTSLPESRGLSGQPGAETRFGNLPPTVPVPPTITPAPSSTFTTTVKPPDTVTPMPTVGPYKKVYYMHQTLELQDWGDGWSQGNVQPGGQMMNEKQPSRSVPASIPLEILKNYYCYSDPLITGKFSPGEYIVELWLGNSDGPINGLLQLHLELTDRTGRPIVDLGMNFLPCKTTVKGPVLFQSEPFRYKETLSIDKCRFKITITPIDSLDLTPHIYWDSYKNGASRLITPMFIPPTRR